MPALNTAAAALPLDANLCTAPAPVCRELVLNSVNVAVLGALFTWGAAPRPSNLGVQDYGGGLRTLSLCPPSPNCISTAEEANDPQHYVPQWWVLGAAGLNLACTTAAAPWVCARVDEGWGVTCAPPEQAAPPAWPHLQNCIMHEGNISAPAMLNLRSHMHAVDGGCWSSGQPPTCQPPQAAACQAAELPITKLLPPSCRGHAAFVVPLLRRRRRAAAATAAGCRTYNPEEGRGRKNPATPEQAMAELAEVGARLAPCRHYVCVCVCVCVRVRVHACACAHFSSLKRSRCKAGAAAG